MGNQGGDELVGPASMGHGSRVTSRMNPETRSLAVFCDFENVALGALYTALMAQSPVVLFSGHAPLGELGKGAFQEVRQAEMAAPVCKEAWVSGPDVAAEVERAIRTALEAIPGPVSLSLPTDVLEAP